MNHACLETLCFRLGTRCNLACGFCRAGSSPLSNDFADVTLFRRFVCDATRHLGLRHVSISGGEPGLDRRLPSLVAWLVEQGLHVTVTTNGTSNVSTKLRHLADAHKSQLRIRVSIDGDRHLHDNLRGSGTYGIASREAERVKQIFGWLGINTVVTPAFAALNLDVMAVVGDLQVDEWSLITPVPEGSARGQNWHVDEILPQLLSIEARSEATAFRGRIVIWNFLGTPHTSVLIKPRGEIVLSGVRGDDDICLGSLANYSLHRIAEQVAEVTRNAVKVHFSWREWSS